MRLQSKNLFPKSEKKTRKTKAKTKGREMEREKREMA